MEDEREAVAIERGNRVPKTLAAALPSSQFGMVCATAFQKALPWLR